MGTKKKMPEVEPPKKPKKTAFFIYSDEKRSDVMKELDTKDITKVCKRLAENWKALAEDEKAVFEARAKAAMDDYEKAKGEYENRPDVKERMAKERAQMLKVEVAAA